MNQNRPDLHDVIIIGGSYSGLSAALALGRARRSVLIVDANEPCNARVPHSHNLLTHDGEAPQELRAQAIADVSKYPTVYFHKGRVTEVSGSDGAFAVRTAEGIAHTGRKLLLAMGVRDELPAITGLAECWGISAAACPFCHGYEVRDQRIALIGNTPDTFEYVNLVHNWSQQLSVLTNGPAMFTEEQRSNLSGNGIGIVEHTISEVLHDKGQVKSLRLSDGSQLAADALFLRSRTPLPSALPASIGIELTEQGLIKVDFMQHTNVPGVFASGDCASPMRALSMAIASGNIAGAVIVHELIHA
ncbi:MAG: NAD(P)/FAD-dependent oxidoreductase [Flavobacteriales bacterium]|jgi:thioredoxin reductase|nr:NAD(P)/FAD-dependent oxidoreductase [Flavobacteriales bacterium]